MSGVTPPVYPIVEPFGASAGSDYIQLPVPVPSQIGITNGEASFTDGFPPLCFTDPTAGGIPPRGKDFNGLLYMITDYCKLIQAGQLAVWNSDASAAFSGYAVGARLVSASTPGRIWINNLDGNTNDPDVNSSGWYTAEPRQGALSLSPGTNNDVALPNAGDLFLDIDTSAGAVNITGFVAQRNGQKLYISNVGSNLLQILALNAGSAAANQLRAPTDMGLITNQSASMVWSSEIGKWLMV